MSPELSEIYFSEKEMAAMLRISVDTLKGRRYRGTEHPPYLELRKGLILYPRDMFINWVGGRRIIYEVKSVGESKAH